MSDNNKTASPAVDTTEPVDENHVIAERREKLKAIRAASPNGIAFTTTSWPTLVRILPIKTEFGNKPLEGEEASASRNNQHCLGSLRVSAIT